MEGLVQGGPMELRAFRRQCITGRARTLTTPGLSDPGAGLHHDRLKRPALWCCERGQDGVVAPTCLAATSIGNSPGRGSRLLFPGSGGVDPGSFGILGPWRRTWLPL